MTQANPVTGQFVNSSTINIPSLSLPAQQFQGARGICTLNHPQVGTLQFRTNPNAILWDYELITHTEQTYGGRVVQILGTKMDNLVVTVDCGQGGWPYAMYVTQFMRDLMVTQRNGQPATFNYTTRGWNLKVYALNVPYHDEVQATVRELQLNFKIQQDVSGLITAASLANALSALVDGIGFASNAFNTSNIVGGYPSNAGGGGLASQLQSTLPPSTPTAATGPPNLGIPGQTNLTNFIGGVIPGL